jgi:hypothetical protein
LLSEYAFVRRGIGACRRDRARGRLIQYDRNILSFTRFVQRETEASTIDFSGLVLLVKGRSAVSMFRVVLGCVAADRRSADTSNAIAETLGGT